MDPRRLTGEERAAYCDRAVALLRAARLNRDWPDVRSLAAHLSALHPAADGGLYPFLDVDPGGGLPTYPMWQRVKTDAEMAEDALAELPDEAELLLRANGPHTLEKDQGSPHIRRLARWRYYTRLRDLKLARLGGMDIKLRRLDPDTDTAHLHVVFDKLDASGCFIRFTADLAQRGAGISVARVDVDVAHETPALHTLVYQSSGLDAELLFLQLSRLRGVQVERVVKGTVGPFLDQEGGSVAHFAQEIVAVDLRADGIADPMYKRPPATAQVEREMARARLGYHVFHDRKFSATDGQVESVKGMCRAMGTRNVVYSAQVGS